MLSPLGPWQGRFSRLSLSRLDSIALKEMPPLISEDVGVLARGTIQCHWKGDFYPMSDDRYETLWYDVQRVIAGLRAGDPQVRSEIARELGLRVAGGAWLDVILVPGVVEALIAALGDKSGEVRVEVAGALGKAGETLRPFTAPHVPASELTRLTRGLMADLGEALVAALQDENPRVRGAVAWALGRIEEHRATNHLVAALGDEHWKPRAAAAWALGLIWPRQAQAPQPLVAAVRDERIEVRSRAARALGAIRDAKAVEPLIAALKDEACEVRELAAKSLGEVGDPRAVSPLIGALGDKRYEVRSAVVWALYLIRDARAVQPLIAALGDRSYVVRVAAASVLSAMPDTRAVEPLIAALDDDRAEVRGAVVSALGEIGDVRAVEPLVDALADDDPFVRHAAAIALAKIGDLAAVEALTAALKDDYLDEMGMDDNLARIVESLRRAQENGGTDNIVIFTADAQRNYYIQFVAERGEAELWANAVSNEFLAPPSTLNSAQTARLKSMGWHPPDRVSGNFNRYWEATNDDQRLLVAREVMRTFVEVYGCLPNQPISVEELFTD